MKQRIQMTWIFVILFGLFLVFVVPVYALPSVFDWDVNDWPVNASPPFRVFSHSYSAIEEPSTTFTYTFSGNIERFLGAPFSPLASMAVTGGIVPLERTLFIGADFENTSESITLTIELDPHAIDVSFTLMDIDSYIPGADVLQQDEVSVVGYRDADVVTPILTATVPANVTVAGNVATANLVGEIGNGTAGGNVEVDFGSAAINRIVIEYRPGPTPIANPEGGGIALHDINFTPSTPTAVSLQSFQAQTPDIVAPLLLASTMIAGFTVVWAVQRKRQLKKVVKPAPVRSTHIP